MRDTGQDMGQARRRWRRDPVAVAQAMVHAGVLSKAAFRAIAYFVDYGLRLDMVDCVWDSTRRHGWVEYRGVIYTPDGFNALWAAQGGPDTIAPGLSSVALDTVKTADASSVATTPSSPTLMQTFGPEWTPDDSLSMTPLPPLPRALLAFSAPMPPLRDGAGDTSRDTSRDTSLPRGPRPTTPLDPERDPERDPRLPDLPLAGLSEMASAGRYGPLKATLTVIGMVLLAMGMLALLAYALGWLAGEIGQIIGVIVSGVLALGIGVSGK